MNIDKGNFLASLAIIGVLLILPFSMLTGCSTNPSTNTPSLSGNLRPTGPIPSPDDYQANSAISSVTMLPPTPAPAARN